ncbi:hypothetical protein [Afipia sp. GAS231]|nr:hypothetical protein [Afipia sp. GAS231]
MSVSDLVYLVRMAALEVMRYGALPYFADETGDLLSWTLCRRQRIMSRE